MCILLDQTDLLLKTMILFLHVPDSLVGCLLLTSELLLQMFGLSHHLLKSLFSLHLQLMDLLTELLNLIISIIWLEQTYLLLKIMFLFFYLPYFLVGCLLLTSELLLQIFGLSHHLLKSLFSLQLVLLTQPLVLLQLLDLSTELLNLIISTI